MRIRNPKHARRFCRRNLHKVLLTSDTKLISDFKRNARFVLAIEQKQSKLVKQLQHIIWTL